MPEEINHYGPTAARAHGRPGREVRPASITIDMHSHVLVPEAAALVQPHVDLSKVPLAHFATDNTKALNRKQDADRRPNMTDVAVRLADMDAAGIDVQVIMPPPPQCTYGIPLDLGIKAARIINAGMASFAAQKPERFTATRHRARCRMAQAAAAELERSMREDGMKGAQVLTTVNGLELSDPQFAPFWAKRGGVGCGRADPSQRLHRWRADAAVLFQQRPRQSARNHDGAALPDLRRRAGAASRR